MTDKIDDGGPAFPHTGYSDAGLSLRDWFAGQTATDWYECFRDWNKGTRCDGTRSSKQFTDHFAGMCYEFADAMLKERDNA